MSDSIFGGLPVDLVFGGAEFDSNRQINRFKC